ncbi:phage tail tape measure protein [Methylovulum miyakonense]|uniref:phage tail tape measure protein n=1 Tax=Methylovulum miyakonense TaxID=645578 RepID=UPI00036A5502|nr:phage tail tape measure protein [Methylovulum miyakonense]
MADIKLETIVDYVLKAGKVENEADFHKSMNQVISALIHKMDAPTAAFDLPVELKDIKLNKTDINKLKKRLTSEIAKIDEQLADNIGKSDQTSKSLRKRQAAVKSLFEDFNDALEKIPTIKVTPKTKQDMQRVLSDPFEIDKILKERNGSKRAENLRAYTQYINDYKKEISDIHRRASEGVKVVTGAGGTFQIIKPEKLSLPGFGSVSQILSNQMAAATKAMQPSEIDKREKASTQKSAIDSEKEADRLRQLNYAARKRMAADEAKVSTAAEKEADRLRQLNYAARKRMAAEQRKDEQKQREVAATALLGSISDQAVHRVGGFSPSQLLSLQPHEQAAVSDSLTAQIKNIKAARKDLLQEMAGKNPASADFKLLNDEYKKLGGRLPELQQGLKFVNSEMRGLAGFTHQAAIATQQFLRYAVLYGAGYKLLSGVGSLFSDTTGLDKALHAIQAISQASKNEMAIVEEAIKGVSEASQFSTSEIAQAAQVLAQAGIQINNLPSILSTVSKLASTTSADLKTSSEVLTSLSEAFDKTEPMQMAALADRLAQAVNVSKLTTEGLRTIISLSASTAKLTGVSDTQLLASAAVLSNRGVKDSTIATGLREMMVELFSPDAKLMSFLKDRYAKIGEGLISEAQIRAKYQSFTKSDDPIQSVLLELKRLGVAGVARNDFNRVTETRAQNVLLPLLDSLDKRIENIAQISQSGAIDRGAATNMEAVSNALSGLESSAVSLNHELISGFFPTIVDITKTLKSLLEAARQNVIQANGESSGSTQRSLIFGAVAGGLAYAKTSGGFIKRGAAALGVGSAASGADTLSHTQGDTGDNLAMAGEAALYAAALSSLAGKTGDVAKKGVVVWRDLYAGIQLFAEAPLLFLKQIPIIRAIAVAAAAAATLYGTYQLFKGQGDPQARLQAATKQMADQQKQIDEHTTAYASFSSSTKDGQAAIVDEARKDFTEAKEKIAKQLGVATLSDEIIKEVTKLGTEGVESGSPAQKEVLERLRKLIDVSDEKVKSLSEAGQSVAASQAIIASKTEQQLREINEAINSADPSAVQKSILATYNKLSEEEKQLITTTKAVTPENFEKVSSALAKAYQLVFEDAPNQMADMLNNKVDAMAAAWTNLEGVDSAGFDRLILSIRATSAAAATATEQVIENNISALEAAKRKLEGDMSHSPASNSSGFVTPVSKEEKAAQEKRHVLLTFLDEQINEARTDLETKKTQTEKERKDKEIADKLAKEKMARESEFSSATSKAGQAQYIGDLANNSKEAMLEEELKKAKETRNLAREKAIQAELLAIKQQESERDLATKVAHFEELFDKSGQTAVQLDGLKNLPVDERAKLYTDPKEQVYNQVSISSAELKAALADVVKAYTSSTITLPGDTSASLAGIDRQQQEKDLNLQQALIQAKLDDVNRQVQLAKLENTLDQQAVQLANEQYGLKLESINVDRALASLHFEDSKVVEAQLAAKRKTAEDERKILLEDANRLRLEKEKASLGKEFRAANKAVEFAVASGNLKGLGALQKDRDALAFRRLENELATMIAQRSLPDDITARKDDGVSNIRNQHYKEQADTSAKYLDNLNKEFQSSKRFTLFTDEQKGFRQATGRDMTSRQVLAESQGQLSVAETHKQAIEQVIKAQEEAKALATTEEGVALFTQRLEESHKQLDQVNLTIGEYKGRIATLTATFMDGVRAISDSGVLAEFEKLNPGFTEVRQQLESHLAGTLDGITSVVGDFIANGFTAVKDLQALSSALQNVAQAQGNYQSTVSNRANLLYPIEASPSFAKESQAVQTLIIQQATTAQKAAEAAAAQQVAIAKAQQAQVLRENSLGGQLSKFFSDSTKSIISTLVRDFLGQGIKNLLGFSEQKNQYDIAGNLKVTIADGLPSVTAVASGTQSADTGGIRNAISSWFSGRATPSGTSVSVPQGMGGVTGGVSTNTSSNADGFLGYLGFTKSAASMAGSALSIGTSLLSIGTTLSSYFDSVDNYDAVLKAATAHNNDAPVLPTSDPTLLSPSGTDTKYGALAGYLSADKYKPILDQAATILAAGSLVQNTAGAAQFVNSSPISTKQSLSGMSVQNNNSVNNYNGSEPAAPQVNVRVINAVDPSVVHDYMSSSQGEKVILNTIHNNSSSIRETLR